MVAFWLGLVGLLFFSLRPAYENGGRTKGLPKFLADWINAHDFLANFLAYAGMAILGLSAGTFSSRSRQQADRTESWMKPWLGIIALAILAVGVEVFQIWIPGRVSDPMDVLAAWSGLVTVWAVEVVLARLLTPKRHA